MAACKCVGATDNLLIVFKITLLKCVVSGTKLSNWKTSTGKIIIVHNENYRGATLEI